MGVLLAAYVAYDVIHQFLDFLRDVAYTREHAGPVMDVLGAALNFLTTGIGNLVAIIIAAILILWALQTEPRQVNSGGAAVVQPGVGRDADQPEQLADAQRELADAKQKIRDLQEELGRRPPRHLGEARAVDLSEQMANKRAGEQTDALARDWLKRECRDMAAYLRWFLKDHEQETEDKILDLYRERYLDKVSVLLQQLEQRGLYPPDHRKSFQIDADKFPRSPMAIRNLAGVLGSIGQGM